MFAGTGATEKTCPFLSDELVKIHASKEKSLVEMIADVSRIRPEDQILFYLTAEGGFEGRFFGVFKAASFPFFDENNENNFLKNKLKKGLSFRVKIKPYKVFSKGLTEHNYLDTLEGRKYPYELCWSLIYRKLKGNRGCTRITGYEYKDFLKRLSHSNNKILRGDNFSFVQETCSIIQKGESLNYTGRQDSMDIRKRLLKKAEEKKAFEAHLQAYIMQNYDKKGLKDFLFPLENCNDWIGNEVSCGVGMQRMDILTIQENEKEVHIRIVELKQEPPKIEIIGEQLEWYIRWVLEYMMPNFKPKKVIIYPMIVAEGSSSKKNEEVMSYSELQKNNKKTERGLVQPLEYIYFELSKDDLVFSRYC